MKSQRSALARSTPTGFDPLQTDGSCFIFFFALSSVLPLLLFAAVSSLVAMQLWTRRLPSSLSFRVTLSFLPSLSFSLTFFVTLVFSPPWLSDSENRALRSSLAFAWTLTLPDEISFSCLAAEPLSFSDTLPASAGARTSARPRRPAAV